MAKFVSMQTALPELENIIQNARERVYLICPHVEASETLLQRLQSRSAENIKVTLIYKTGNVSLHEKQAWLSLKNVSLRHLPNLHAKCFFNEESMIIGSLNLLDKSAVYSREMGLLISSTEDNRIFTLALNEAKIIVNSSMIDDVRKPVENTPGSRPETPATGFCIRCGAVMPCNLKKPFCPACYDVWAEWDNPDYVENFCHLCGEPAVTAMSRPQCDKCRRNYPGTLS